MRRIVCLSLLVAPLIALPALGESLTVMTFNVENLFDNTHDRGKNDETYLPVQQKQSKSHIDKCNKINVKRWRDQCLYWDWNDAVVDRKLTVIGDAIRQVGDDQGPDIIVFQEVENKRILERLRTEQLKGLGYQPSVLLEGKDIRGIDVAVLSKFPVTDPKLHEIRFPASQRARIGDTRPILEATFNLPDGSLLTGFAVHFPAPFHPTEMRESAYTTLNTLLKRLPADRAVFAAGDFNTTREEDNDKHMLDRWVRDDWEVAHDLCEGCQGTSYYPPRDDWSFLDMVIWRPATGWRMTASYLANETPAQVTPAGTPKRFELPEATGLSDHWPLVMVIEKPAD
ncbi:MAG: endonuclease/exonuclease/phosphatase family protein [Gammaproteobacteria bacterium TMED50]|nr:MAG: endonuclease/exonuclease/phosphatase family protein [Gammaproteobacteria bacterium TMED50]